MLVSIQIKEHWVIVQDLFVFLDYRSFRLLFRIVPVIVPHRSIGATIGANLRFIGAIGAIIGANIEFIGDISYDTLQSGIHEYRISYGKDVNNWSAVTSF